jgi:hypothetical protein
MKSKCIIFLTVVAGLWLINANESPLTGQDPGNMAMLTSDSSLCMANFVAIADSNPSFSYIFLFFDHSVGNPNHWFWTFGDQTTSTEQNPVHQYNAPGNYQVCLTITRDETGYYCTDDTCMTVTIPRFYDLGGFAFAGNYPINNPDPEGDTAIAYLFRLDSNLITPVRSRIFSDLGYYWFTGLAEGRYLVKIQLLPNTTHYDTYIPAYYKDALFWSTAMPINLIGESIYDADVHLSLAQDKFGPGMISGTISLDTAIFDDMVFSPANAEVLLFDSIGMPLQSRFTDDYGNFVFSGLAFDEYKLMAEMTGFIPVFSSVVLTPDNALVNNVVLIVCEQGAFGIEEYSNKSVFKLKNLYPNPVTDQLYLDVSSEKEYRIYVILCNEMTQKIQRLPFTLQKGRQTLHIRTGTLTKGLYLLMISTPEGVVLQTKKFIK